VNTGPKESCFVAMQLVYAVMKRWILRQTLITNTRKTQGVRVNLATRILGEIGKVPQNWSVNIKDTAALMTLEVGMLSCSWIKTRDVITGINNLELACVNKLHKVTVNSSKRDVW
jgi:hypothetical protein